MSRQFLKTAASRTAIAIGAATIAAVVVAGSLSVAQAATEAIPNNSVTSAKIVNGTIQGIDIKPGAVGPGQLGLNARPRWAKVDAGVTTSLIRGRGAVSASRISAGVYAAQSIVVAAARDLDAAVEHSVHRKLAACFDRVLLRRREPPDRAKRTDLQFSAAAQL